MEDPNMEWEIQEYSPSEKGEVTRVRWILNKGLGLGKKVVITGIAISSAPLFVPPLVVFSALWFAFSVPFGLVFASYASTDKVMSKLLPTPEPYPMIDSYTDENEDDDYWQKDVDGYEVQPTVYADENVGEESEEDVGEDVEEEDDYMGEIQKEIEVGDRYVEEQDYEDIGDNVEREDDLVARVVKGGEEEFIGNEVEVQQDTGNKEERFEDEEEIVRGSTGLLEKIRDARNIGNEVEEETRGAEIMHRVGEGEVDKNISIRESADSFGDDDGLMNKPIEEAKGMGEKKRFVEETKMPFQEDDVTTGKPEKIKSTAVQTRDEERDVPCSLKKVGETEDTVVGNGNNIHDLNKTVNVQVIGQNVDRTMKERRPVVAKIVEVKEGREADNTSTGVPEDIAAKMRLENRDADIREIADESGLHLYDDRNAASHQKSYTASQNLDVDDNLKEGTVEVEVDVDYMALPTSVRVSESNNVKRGAAKEAVRSEVLLKEEKMWEQINALRAIVGYTAAPQTACVEEVKALYIFTGVETPFSFKDPSDLADINEKLRFLMSIVGVK